MVCRMRQSSRMDPPLYPGLGVQMPDELYHNWLRKYITEEDVSRFTFYWSHRLLIAVAFRFRAASPSLR